MMLGAGGAGERTYIEDVFSNYLFTGTNTHPLNIVNGIDLTEHGGAVFGKPRSGAYNWTVHDTMQGVQKGLAFNGTQGQYDNTGNQGGSTTRDLTNFNSNGFTLGTAWSASGINPDGIKVGTYTFRQCPGFFDVVTYTGNNETAFNVSHDLGVKPGAILIKSLAGATPWFWWSKGMQTDENLQFNTNGQISDDSNYDLGASLTSTTFRVPAGSDINYQGTYVAYLWADGDEAAAQVFGVDGNKPLTKMGYYTGNSSVNEVNLGFEPQWVLIKRFDSGESEHWFVFDSMRGWSNSTPQEAIYLRPNSNGGDDYESSNIYFNPTATGFRLEASQADYNQNNGKYLYFAIRRADGYVSKPAEAGTEVFAMDWADDNHPKYLSGFPIDFMFKRRPAVDENYTTGTRLSGKRLGYINYVASAWTTNGSITWDSNTHFYGGGGDDPDVYLAWMWKRHAGFDVAVYVGNGSSGRTVNHSLSKTPEMIWVKNRDSNDNWRVYHSGLNGGTNPEQYSIKLNSTSAEADRIEEWNDTAPTATQITLGNSSSVNDSGDDHIALLFASVTGISKVGSYTGNGSATGTSVTTGFTVRFLIIKRTASADSWVLIDTERGFTTSASKYLQLNDDASQENITVAKQITDGFQISSTWSGVNTSGENYIYYAHA